MSKEEIHQAAQADTPRYVDVPASTPALILWLLGRFGVAVVFAASTFYVYQDMRSDRRELFDAYRANIEVIRDFKHILETQGRKLDDISMRREKD
jgi:hypothetical protein